MSGVTCFRLKLAAVDIEAQSACAEVEAEVSRDAGGREVVRVSMRGYFTQEQIAVLAGNLMALAGAAGKR